MKGVIKANTVDKYLHPIRKQIVELIEPNTTVVEYGCGNGNLLFKLSAKIRIGIGLDKSESLIKHASNRRNKENIQNLDFKVIDLTKEPISTTKFDYSVSSLLLHILTWKDASELLKNIVAQSETTIICGFSKPESTRQRILIWLDQRFTSHYSNYRIFKKKGFTEGLLNTIDNIKITRFDTFDPVIKIYKITKHNIV